MKIKISLPSIFGFDFFLFISVQILMIIGIFFIYSSAVNASGAVLGSEYIKQIIWVISGDILLLAVSFLDYKIFKSLAPWFFLFMMGLLLLTAFFGKLTNGARSWLGIGMLGIQPSELSKLAAILFLASYLDNNKNKTSSLKVVIISCFIIFIPLGLILMQPDLGTCMVFIPILLIMLYTAGCRIRHLVIMISIGLFTIFFTVYPYYHTYILKSKTNMDVIFSNSMVIMVSAMVLGLVFLLSATGYFFSRKSYFYYLSALMGVTDLAYILSFPARSVLKDYQIMRLIIFLDPQIDPRGAGWNIIQSVTAIGSGGLLGKGYLKGTQSHYRYLPEQSTDFIFSIISEETGFMGNVLIIFLFAVIFWRCLRIIMTSQDLFGSLIAAGLLGMLFFHFMINIGMAMGIMPITGIPLIFLSYGGSSLWTALAGLGILLSVYHRRYKNVI